MKQKETMIMSQSITMRKHFLSRAWQDSITTKAWLVPSIWISSDSFLSLWNWEEWCCSYNSWTVRSWRSCSWTDASVTVTETRESVWNRSNTDRHEAEKSNRYYFSSACYLILPRWKHQLCWGRERVIVEEVQVHSNCTVGRILM